jgi:glycerate 2-kinase
MFRDTVHSEMSSRHETALACLEAGVTAALPKTVVESTIALEDETLRVQDHEYDLEQFDEILVLGGGKATGGLAAALVDLLGPRITDGVVVTTGSDEESVGPVAVREGDHPTPSRRNVEATEALLERAAAAGERTLVLAAITGGASALLCAPAEGLSLSDLRSTTDALLESGASIHEINAVRKHCSSIKGGQFARRAGPATVVTLAISDVVGDDPSVIGSGPTVPDSSSFDDAVAVLERYGVRDEVPVTVREHLERGAAGEREETPDGTDPAVANAGDDWHCLANGRTGIDAAREVARERGYEPLVLSSRLTGEAREVGGVHAAIGAEIAADGDPLEAPAVVLSGGEVTVTVGGGHDGDSVGDGGENDSGSDDSGGTGGPNQELALAAALEFAANETDAVLASVDTDGIDGPTDAAGAIVDGETIASEDRPAARRALSENAVYCLLEAKGALLEPGYTGTNVNDLRALVVGDPSGS